MDLDELTRRLAERCVYRVSAPDEESIAVHFIDGSVLRIKRHREGVAATFVDCPSSTKRSSHKQPTRRQLEYLAFIRKYLLKFRVGPAESDIERHFLVSAPSVNQMVRSLERSGFITRERDGYGRCVPRSIRLAGEE